MGDENRTRTISLGIFAIRADSPPELRGRVSTSDRQRPLVTGANGPANGTAGRPSWLLPGLLLLAMAATQDDSVYIPRELNRSRPALYYVAANWFRASVTAASNLPPPCPSFSMTWSWLVDQFWDSCQAVSRGLLTS